MEAQFQLLLKATIDRLSAEQKRNRRFAQIDEQKLRLLFKKQTEAKSCVSKDYSPSSIREQATTNRSENKPKYIEFENHEDLQQCVSSCVKCENLATSRKNVVFGSGNKNASLMFIGEAPGVDEDIQGEPFVGKAGQLLTKIIQAMGLKREEVYIANILKCRPDTPGQKYGNRKPTHDEMKECIPYLWNQVKLVQPNVIVALGATALQGLFENSNESISRSRGNWRDFKGIPLMPTFHPSYLLHKESNPAQALQEKRKVWEDMLKVKEKLKLPISEKELNYFKKTG